MVTIYYDFIALDIRMQNAIIVSGSKHTHTPSLDKVGVWRHVLWIKLWPQIVRHYVEADSMLVHALVRLRAEGGVLEKHKI